MVKFLSRTGKNYLVFWLLASLNVSYCEGRGVEILVKVLRYEVPVMRWRLVFEVHLHLCNLHVQAAVLVDMLFYLCVYLFLCLQYQCRVLSSGLLPSSID